MRAACARQSTVRVAYSGGFERSIALAFQQSWFRRVCAQIDGQSIGQRSFVPLCCALQQVGANRVIDVIALQGQIVERTQCGSGPMNLGDCRRSIHCHNQRRLMHEQCIVKLQDLRPIAATNVCRITGAAVIDA